MQASLCAARPLGLGRPTLRAGARPTLLRCSAHQQQQQQQQQQAAAAKEQQATASAALALGSLLLSSAPAALAEEAEAAAEAAGGAAPTLLGYVLVASPILFYGLFNVYRSVVDPRAKFGDAVFAFAALILLGNIVSIAVFKIRLF